MDWYYNLIVRRPWIVILGITIFSLACIIVSFTTRDLPNFSDPILGFEARGTNIGKRLRAWKNLLEETRPSGKLFSNPEDLIFSDNIIEVNFKNENNLKKYRQNKLIISTSQQTKEKNKTKPFKKKNKLRKGYTFNETDTNQFNLNNTNLKNISLKNDDWAYGKNRTFLNEDQFVIEQLEKDKWTNLKNLTLNNDIKKNKISNEFFCGSPSSEYAHIVVERNSLNKSISLYEINALLSICDLQKNLQQIKGYEVYCQRQLYTNDCCKPWSLSNYIALLVNKTSCSDINQKDIAFVRYLLVVCSEYYQNFKLGIDCIQHKCRVPDECAQHNAIFNILHYITDVNFIKLNDSDTFLESSMIFLPIGRSTKILPFYHNILKESPKNKFIDVIAMDFGLKNALFDESLFSDAWLILLSAILVMSCMCFYTSSFFVTLMTIIATGFSLGIAYFCYTIIIEMSFFPFMNLLAIIVIVGIGADDTFIFIKIWQCTAAERIKFSNLKSSSSSDIRNSKIFKSLVISSLKDAAISMFVTSITTAAAFFASYISSITSIKCFGIFAGIMIISNYFLMITWLPASVSIMERIPFSLNQILPPKILQKMSKSIFRFTTFLEVSIIKYVTKYPKFWITLLGTIGISSCFLVLHWPRLRLPESPDFQLFTSNHPFELYESKYLDKFWFEKSLRSVDNYNLPLRFVWGVLPIDSGDYSNPYSKGELFFDKNFNISSKASQEWLLGFCGRLKNQTFFKTTYGILMLNCFIEHFITWMNRSCIDKMDYKDRTPCCEISKFPYDPNIFNECLPQCISSLYATPREYFIPGFGGPKFELLNGNFSKFKPKVKVIVIEYESNFSFSLPYTEVSKFVTIVNEWFTNELKTAPLELQDGWFTSELDFFDLQDTLSKGTIFAIGMAMGGSLIVLLFVTLNILVSIYAVITVTFIIFTTVAILMLIGWKLNILESVSVSTAIGLAVDFSLHYGIQYRLSSKSDRDSSTEFALKRMMGPTAMAAITTGIAGALMLLSNVLPYIQIGIFLVTVMTVSWIYSTFFLMSLLKVLGPQYGFMQFHYSILMKGKKNENKDFKTRSQFQRGISELLLTPSHSPGDFHTIESNELHSLELNSVINTISSSENVQNSKCTNTKEKVLDTNCSPYGSKVTVVLPYEAEYKVLYKPDDINDKIN